VRSDQGNVLLDVLLLVFSGVLALTVMLAPDPGPRTIETIELDMEPAPLRNTRNIPRPRSRPEKIRPANVEAMVPTPVPRQIASSAPVEQLDLAVPRLDTPGEMGDLGPLQSAGDLAMSASAAAAGFMTRSDYQELLRMRIESRKIYPDAARSRGKQGRVVVRFTIEEDGSIREKSLVRGSGTDSLDRAALRAVSRAAPFPMAPADLFAFPLTLQIEICFELT
jgi:periplasmic protein TonB